MLLLLHGAFTAGTVRENVYRFQGKFIADNHEINIPICIMEVVMNLLHGYHLLLSWYQLHHSTRNFWKIWLEWCWMGNSLSFFIAHVRRCIKLHILQECGDCDKCATAKNKQHK